MKGSGTRPPQRLLEGSLLKLSNNVKLSNEKSFANNEKTKFKAFIGVSSSKAITDLEFNYQ
jgi:hypothetical protein